jgi:hypothetical protein
MNDKEYSEKSHQRLERIASQKIKTTMIGAISSIEEHFGFLLENSDSENDNKEIFNRLRSDILDKGNQQIRNLSKELKLYDISLKRFQYTLPVRKIGE